MSADLKVYMIEISIPVLLKVQRIVIRFEIPIMRCVNNNY